LVRHVRPVRGALDAASDAERVAEQFGLGVLGVYHTWCGGHPNVPDSDADALRAVPAPFRTGLVLITDISGGESIFGSTCYAIEPEGGWKPVSFRIVSAARLDPALNARRIHHAWLSLRGQLDYSNNHETELRRLYGES